VRRHGRPPSRSGRSAARAAASARPAYCLCALQSSRTRPAGACKWILGVSGSATSPPPGRSAHGLSAAPPGSGAGPFRGKGAAGSLRGSPRRPTPRVTPNSATFSSIPCYSRRRVDVLFRCLSCSSWAGHFALVTLPGFTRLAHACWLLRLQGVARPVRGPCRQGPRDPVGQLVAGGPDPDRGVG